MWPLNFQDVNKLHMSIGAGLMVAAFILLITQTSEFTNLVSDQNAQIIETAKFFSTTNITSEWVNAINKSLDNQKNLTISLASFYEASLDISHALFYAGLFFFFIGYFPFAAPSYKKFSKWLAKKIGSLVSWFLNYRKFRLKL
jgi:predicted small secreted protein